MEPPAVTSCGVGGHQASGMAGASGQPKRDISGVGAGFIQIDPQLSFNAPNRHFEELPENFLETISPQQQGHGGGGGGHHHSMAGMGGGHDRGGNTIHSTTSPQLASLTTVSMAGGGSANGGNSGYANLVPMPNSSHYISSLKMESMEHLSHPQLHSSGQLEKTNFGNGPAGLLSPLQLEGGRGGDPGGSLGLLSSVSVSHLHRPNGGSRTSDLLSGIRRSTNNVAYIKEEINPVGELGGYQTAPTASHHHDAYGDASAYSMQGPSAQELERMANAETPPALSNVEITSSILASLSRDSPSPQQHSPHHQPTHFIVHQMPSRQQQSHPHQMVQHPISSSAAPTTSTARRSKAKQHHTQHALQSQQSASNLAVGSGQTGYGPMGPGAGIPRATYSTSDTTDPLNAEIDDEIYIDTKDLCKRVAYELKQHSIPQAIFAERILCRSQGTLSDLLRNPKPWNRLKSGRETFRRMFNWLQQPLHIRLSILDMYKGPMASGMIPPPTPAQNSRHHHRNRRTSDGNEEGGNAPQKRPRLVFTDIQKRTLQAIFKETQRPSREMQQTIAEHLRLDMSTVSNFFMNARRRSRNGSGMGDEPAPYQQIRTITPPPDSPPTAQQHQQMIVTSSEHPLHHQPLIMNAASSSSSSSVPRRTPKSVGLQHHQSASSASNLSHIEETVDEVVIRSVAYARSKQQQEQQQQFSSMPSMHSENALFGSPQNQHQQPPIWEDDDLGNAPISQVHPTELHFMDESGIHEPIGDDSELIEQKQENEEGDINDNVGVKQSIERERTEEGNSNDTERASNVDDVLTEGTMRPDPKTPSNLRKRALMSNEDEEHLEGTDDTEREEAIVEAEAPTEPGTPLQATDIGGEEDAQNGVQSSTDPNDRKQEEKVEPD